MTAARILLVAVSAATLSACSTLGGLWPFGGGKPSEAPEDTQDGRISILTFEQELKADAGLKGTLQAPPPAPLAEWTQPGGTAVNAPGHIAGPAEPKVAWRKSVEGSNSFERLTAPPIVAAGLIFVLDAGQTVRAMRADTGEEVWSRRLRSENNQDKVAMGGGLAYLDGRLFAASGFAFLMALDAQTGAVLWRTPTNAPFHSAPSAFEGRVFAATNDSELFAFDAATGQVLWTHQAISEPARVLAASSPAVDPDAVIAPFPSGELVALVPANGRRLWVDALTRAGRLTSLSAINDVAGRPAVAGDTVYAISHSGVLAAINDRNGQRLWALGLASTQTPWVAGNAVFVITTESELAAIDRQTGRAFWVTQLQGFENQKKKKGRISWTGPILVGGNLIAASSQGEVVFADPETGEIRRTMDLKAPVFVPPVAANGMIYFLTDEGRLVALA